MKLITMIEKLNNALNTNLESVEDLDNSIQGCYRIGLNPCKQLRASKVFESISFDKTPGVITQYYIDTLPNYPLGYHAAIAMDKNGNTDCQYFYNGCDGITCL